MENESLQLLSHRMGITPVSGARVAQDLVLPLGGYSQQDRMIRDKRKTLDRATRYSYQGAIVQKVYDPLDETTSLLDDGTVVKDYRALINPNKLKPDYDDKIISIGFEAGFKCGDVFEWKNTGTHWLITNQDLTELAYFRGDIRRCSAILKYDNGDGVKSVYATIRGPVETTIDHWTKSEVRYDSPNYTLNIIIPKNPDSERYFVRYAKFYLNDGVINKCWRVEAVDSFRLENVIEFTAKEYYSNSQVDDVIEGIAKNDMPIPQPIGLITDPTLAAALSTEDQEEPRPHCILGEDAIKAKRTYTFTYTGTADNSGTWNYNKKLPIEATELTDDQGHPVIKLKWKQTYGGEIKLSYGDSEPKIITVASLF